MSSNAVLNETMGITIDFCNLKELLLERVAELRVRDMVNSVQSAQNPSPFVLYGTTRGSVNVARSGRGLAVQSELEGAPSTKNETVEERNTVVKFDFDCPSNVRINGVEVRQKGADERTWYGGGGVIDVAKPPQRRRPDQVFRAFVST